MKKIKYVWSVAMAMLFTTWMGTSCTDGNDWETDASYSRLFSIQSSSLSVAPSATTAEVKWTKTPGSEYFIIEVSKDSLYDAIPMNNGNSILFGEDQSIVKSPFVLSELDSDSKYFIRIKALSSSKSESIWTYSDTKSFRTKAEQIMNPVAAGDKSQTSVTLSWKAGERVTKIELLKGAEVILSKTLTAEEVADGKVTITDLMAGTAYQANLYNNEVRRGYATFSTFPNAPAAEVVLYLEATDLIDQTYLDELATTYPGKSITLALAGNATYTVATKLTIPDGMSINFFGLPGDNKTVLSLNLLDYAGNHNFITFQNLNLDCSNNGYLTNQSAAANVGRMEFDDCIVQNLVTTFFRMQGSNAREVNTLVINNCVFRSIGANGGYYFIHVGSGTGGVKNLAISNSTFDNVCGTAGGKGFIYSQNTNMESLTISNCTFYKIGGGDNYFIDFGSTSYTAATFSITNTILSMAGGNGTSLRGIRSKNAPSITDTYTTTDWAQSASAVTYSKYNGLSTDLFVDPVKGDFTIKDAAFNSNLGDPRWKE